MHAVPRGVRLAVQACRLEAGEGQQKDLDLLFGVSNNIVGKTLCAFGDAAATPVLSTMKLFRQVNTYSKGGARCPPSGGQNSRSSLELTNAAMDLRSLIQLGIIGLTFFMLINASALLVYAERKVMGFMQQRYGPYLVGPHGCCSRWPTS